MKKCIKPIVIIFIEICMFLFPSCNQTIETIDIEIIDGTNLPDEEETETESSRSIIWGNQGIESKTGGESSSPGKC